jgi:hypothetical protein
MLVLTAQSYVLELVQPLVEIGEFVKRDASRPQEQEEGKNLNWEGLT